MEEKKKKFTLNFRVKRIVESLPPPLNVSTPYCSSQRSLHTLIASPRHAASTKQLRITKQPPSARKGSSNLTGELHRRVESAIAKQASAVSLRNFSPATSPRLNATQGPHRSPKADTSVITSPPKSAARPRQQKPQNLQVSNPTPTHATRNSAHGLPIFPSM